jgi:uncharacterized protein YggU (UPF0235/DUF167 family)
LKITVKVKPNARENTLKLLDSGIYEAKVSVPPEKGKANNKVIELLSEHLMVPKSKITLVSGQTFKEKVFEIKD